MKSFQDEVSQWAESTFGKSTSPNGKILHLFDELEEIFVECENDIQREEVADAGLITLHLAKDFGIIIEEISAEYQFAMRKKFEICKKRNWQRNENGRMKHVEEV